MKMQVLLRVLLLTIFSVIVIPPQDAHAGLTGCSRQPNPGGYLNCALNGPFGESGPNSVACRAECRALRNCLNNPPASGCGSEYDDLEACAPGVHDSTYPNHAHNGGTNLTTGNGSVGYSATLGCYLVRQSTYASAESLLNLHDDDQRPGNGDGSQSANLPDSSCVLVSYGDVASHASADSFVTSAVALQFGIAAEDVDSADDLYSDYGASWDDVQAVAQSVAGSFNFVVEDEVVDHMNTVGDLINCVVEATNS